MLQIGIHRTYFGLEYRKLKILHQIEGQKSSKSEF
jgi:hypothetical protein